MTDIELSKKLREDARKLGLCDMWYVQWKDDTSKEKLVSMFHRGLDFCIKHRWPSKSFITQHFSQEFLRDNGILVDDTRSYPVRVDRKLVHLKEFVLFGDSHATIRYAYRQHMCNVWVCDNSTVRVDVKYGAFILIHLFDNSSANIKTDNVSTVTVIRHSRSVTVKKDGMVHVKDEFHYLE